MVEDLSPAFLSCIGREGCVILGQRLHYHPSSPLGMEVVAKRAFRCHVPALQFLSISYSGKSGLLAVGKSCHAATEAETWSPRSSACWSSGTIKMKALACSYMWWPNIDEAITAWDESCQCCQKLRPALPPSPANTWGKPQSTLVEGTYRAGRTFPWLNFMVAVNVYSKWHQCHPTPLTPSSEF